MVESRTIMDRFLQGRGSGRKSNAALRTGGWIPVAASILIWSLSSHINSDSRGSVHAWVPSSLVSATNSRQPVIRRRIRMPLAASLQEPPPKKGKFIHRVKQSTRRFWDSLRDKERSKEELKLGIAGFYDRSSKLWENVWGEHMHHGYVSKDWW
jgi:hypothetical protein